MSELTINQIIKVIIAVFVIVVVVLGVYLGFRHYIIPYFKNLNLFKIFLGGI